MPDDLQTIRETLIYYQRFFGNDPAALPAVEALAALDRLQERVLPEVPTGGIGGVSGIAKGGLVNLYQEVVFCWSHELKATMDALHARSLRILAITPVVWERSQEWPRHTEALRFMVLAETFDTHLASPQRLTDN